MNLEIFFGLIGLPAFILITAVVCYIHTGRKDKKVTSSRVSNDMNSKGGVSQ
ncbi:MULTISPECIES: hypothetical protein [unclassified Sutcliffiella]|uniref:hypothetical protein n=1 Tax=unclassified Sutcliffiella TaxID=2837532 RepID=UPI0030D49C13